MCVGGGTRNAAAWLQQRAAMRAARTALRAAARQQQRRLQPARGGAPATRLHKLLRVGQQPAGHSQADAVDAPLRHRVTFASPAWAGREGGGEVEQPVQGCTGAPARARGEQAQRRSRPRPPAQAQHVQLSAPRPKAQPTMTAAARTAPRGRKPRAVPARLGRCQAHVKSEVPPLLVCTTTPGWSGVLVSMNSTVISRSQESKGKWLRSIGCRRHTTRRLPLVRQRAGQLGVS